ncbi:hypothetical protein [Weeksella virosa]|uniref:hypothetical protein n=1 Tax=Weeksella virosa TaxID=1014 RepID=UPI0011D140DB|nr:hypothetical protein [Weeksella virosa]MDK7675080.1 hypothetical protein [Weeksella virosa]
MQSTKDLTEDEANGLLYLLGRANKSIHTYHAHFDYSNGQHRYVLSLCYQLNWTVWSEKAKKMVVDQERLGKFIMSNKSPVRKPLSNMTKQELSKLIYVLEKL